jgi:hypothetical protein
VSRGRCLSTVAGMRRAAPSSASLDSVTWTLSEHGRRVAPCRAVERFTRQCHVDAVRARSPRCAVPRHRALPSTVSRGRCLCTVAGLRRAAPSSASLDSVTWTLSEHGRRDAPCRAVERFPRQCHVDAVCARSPGCAVPRRRAHHSTVSRGRCLSTVAGMRRAAPSSASLDSVTWTLSEHGRRVAPCRAIERVVSRAR